MHFVKRWLGISTVAVCVLLTACGGGGGGKKPPPPAPAPSGLSYPAPPAFTVGTAIGALSPSVSGTVTTYTIAPALPAGLALSATTGVISGTPTAVTANANYVVTAGNATGSTTATLAIEVNEPAPAISYAAPPALSQGTAITAITPTVTGNVTGWTITPALSAGLTFDTSTGVISGTPTTYWPTTAYTVTATNSTGQGTATVSITVNGTFKYPSTVYSLPKDVALGEIRPEPVGFASTWSVSPALPPGITLLADTGFIIGKPTAVSARATYHITVNLTGGGSAVSDVQLGVTDGVLVDLGHDLGIAALHANGQRMLSTDARGHSVLWNQQTGANLFSETLPCAVDCASRAALAGGNVALSSDDDIEIRTAATGALLARIPFGTTFGTWWRLASDGSYVVGGTAAGLTVWSPSGTVLLTRSGDYRDARPFAAAGELRIPRVVSGAAVLEKITVPGGAVTTTNLQGAFHSWFDDGERFLTRSGNTVWVYSKDGVQEDLVALPTLTDLAGTGNWFWIRTNSQPALQIYAVGSSATPAASFNVDPSLLPTLITSGTSLAVTYYGISSMSVIDLSGGTPTKTDHTSPIPGISAFASASTTDWAIGAGAGVVLGELGGGTPQRYSYGAAKSIAASDQRVVVATASGSILSFDSSTFALETTIPFRSSKVQLSADGAVLGASATDADSQYSTDRTLNFYSMPTGTVSFSRPYALLTPGTPSLFGWTMSRSGTTVGEVIDLDPLTSDFRWVVTQLDGTPIYSIDGDLTMPSPAVTLSPDGSRSALTTHNLDFSVTTTNLYSGATLVGAADGWGVGWLDDSRILVNRYTAPRPGSISFAGVDIANGTGVVQTHLAGANTVEFQPISATRIYAPANSTIFDLADDGRAVWTSSGIIPGTGVGAVAGPNVFFARDAAVRIGPL